MSRAQAIAKTVTELGRAQWHEVAALHPNYTKEQVQRGLQNAVYLGLLESTSQPNQPGVPGRAPSVFMPPSTGQAQAVDVIQAAMLSRTALELAWAATEGGQQ